jgi:hypothetical protein
MPSFTINVDGTNYTVGYDGTFNSPQGLLPALNNLGFGIFWIEEIGGNNVLTTVDNDNVFGDVETNADPTTTSTTTTTTTASPIPTTTSTTTTTTAAPTTSTTTTTTTAAATSTTTTTTTAAPTTSTTTTTTTAASTSTTTTTTTAIPTLYVDLNGANACSGIGTSLPTYLYSGGTTLCDCTSLNAANATSLSAGTYFVSDGVDRRQFTSTGGGSTLLTAAGTCSACPIPTTSTTTTTTTLPPFTANIATTNAYDACNAPELSDLVFYGNGLNACDSTSVTISATLAAYLSAGQTFYINDRVDGIFYSSQWARVGSTTTATRNTTCVECVIPTTTTSTTTTTTTALPTNVWNTNSAAVSTLAACSAPKDVYVWTYGNAWGVGIVYYAGTNLAPLDPLQPYSGGDFFYEYGGQVINIDDNGVGSNLEPCPTITSTTTTTTTAAFDYYFADEVDCFNSCSSISADVLVKFVGGSIVTLNKYYKNTANNKVYLLNSTATEGTAEELNPLLYNDCGSACSGITTTTTTTTAAPTTTTSTTTTTTTAAPTTTSTTTTTTTLAGVSFGVSLNTKYGTDFLACTGTVTGVVYQKAQFGNTPTVGAQLYTSSTTGAGTEWSPSQGVGLYLMQFGGSTKWSVLVGSSGIINTVTSCSGVSTTTTTTTAAPTTTSTTTTSTTPAPTTTTSTTTSTTTAAPTFVWNTNSAAVSAQAACSATKDVYVWTFGNAWGAGIVFYAGTAGAPSQPIQPYSGGGFFYENGGQVINIDDNGVSSNIQPCPTTTTTTPAPTYSQYLDCVNNPYYTYNTNVGNGTSTEVTDSCVFYQGETSSPTGTFFTDFTAGGGCVCP